MRVCSVVGTGLDLLKMASLVQEMGRRGVEQTLVHSGPIDDASSGAVFEGREVPRPDVHLGVADGTQARQTAAIMVAFELTCEERRPDLVIVVGDHNAALAAAVVATKLRIPVAHLGAGLRSCDRATPVEINRILVDHVSNLLFVAEPGDVDNLRREGIAADSIHLVGDDPDAIVSALARVLLSPRPGLPRPRTRDGRADGRIAGVATRV